MPMARTSRIGSLDGCSLGSDQVPKNIAAVKCFGLRIIRTHLSRSPVGITTSVLQKSFRSLCRFTISAIDTLYDLATLAQ